MMRAYASRTGTRRNLDALRHAGWGLLISRAGVWRTEGFADYVLDPGAWTDFRLGRPFDAEAYDRLLDKLGAGARFIILPDIVAGGLGSLELSLRWSNRVRACCDLVLIPVQDGMEDHDLRPLLGAHVGLFLGGSTSWKLETAIAWGRLAVEVGCWFHFARVNTLRRFRLAHAAGADSIDGSSASRFASTMSLLEGGRRQPDLLSPRRAA